MADPYSQVVDGLRKLKASGASRDDAAAFATRSGWTLDELKLAHENGDSITNWTAPVLQGASFGFGDEIMAGAQAAFTDKTYDQALAIQEAILKRARSERPITSTVTEIAGALGPGIASAPLAIAKTVGGTIARSAGLGGVTGGIYGAGANNDDRLQGAATGTATGTVLGAAIPAATEGAKAFWRGVRGLATPKVAAQAELNRAIARDGMTAGGLSADAATKANIAPGAATLADAGGEEVKGLVERIGNTPGAGRSKVIRFLEQRQRSQYERLARRLRNLTGTQDNAFDALEKSIESAKQNALPHKRAAMQTDISGNAELQGLVDGIVNAPSGRRAFRAAQTIAGNEGRSIPDGGPYSMRDVDYLFQGLNKVIGDNTNFDQIGRPTVNPVGASVVGLKKRLAERLDVEVPEYATFRRMWSGEANFRNAIEQGRRIVAMSSDELRFKLRSMNASEREGFIIGAVGELSSRMGRNNALLPDLTKNMRSPEMRAKIDLLLPNDTARAAFDDAFQFEQGVSDMTRKVTANSRTSFRDAMQDDRNTADLAVDIATENLTQGQSLLMLLLRRVGYVPTAVRDTLRSRVDNELADVLMQPITPGQLPAIAAPRGAYAVTPGRGAVGSAAALAQGLLPNEQPANGQFPY